MYFNPSYMNPIAQQPMQQEFSQQPTQEPLEGIASLPAPPQMTPPPGGIQPVPPSQPATPGGNEIGNQIIQPGQPSLPFDIAPIIPYQKNENLDLTDRAGIMSEYNKYLQGGLGSNIHTADMQSGYSFMDQAMGPGSSTGFSDFRNFLDTFGIGDRLKNTPNQLMQDAINKLQQVDMGKYEPVNDQEGIQSLSTYQSQQNTGPGI
jgi:hypothetical protein